VRVAVLSALGPITATGVVGYGGIERAAFWLAEELVRRGHEVTLVGNVDEGPAPGGWTGVKIGAENELLRADSIAALSKQDVVHDFTHQKPFALARHAGYLATTMWTDRRGGLGRDVYPSAAVREAFKDLDARVVPIGVRVDGSHTDLPAHDGDWLSFGRIAHHKGVDISLAVAGALKLPLVVAGHVWPGIDEYYGLCVARECRRQGFAYVPDPDDAAAAAAVRRAKGLLHPNRWLESFSIVAAEALCYGTPVLASDQGAPQEWVRATDGGMVAELKHLEAGRWEAAGARDFFERNWDPYRAGIAKRARALFDVRVVAETYEGIYRRLAR
jgi:glycosyltransferase involved in cell wall biosynthesis